ncbi:MAG: hypothetical protein ABSB96_04255 [Gaiellaceae bacterium]
MALDRGLDGLNTVMRLIAEMSFVPAADEVVVLATVAAASAGEKEPASALRTEERPAQVVVVAPGALAALALGIEDLLHLLEGGLVDERLVASLVVAAGIAKATDVVVVSENR